jgi:hypothetical protein
MRFWIPAGQLVKCLNGYGAASASYDAQAIGTK